MDSTDHAPATLVVVWDAATAASKLGSELAAAMEGGSVPGIKRWCCYQVVPTLPLSGLAGCRCFLFKRRKMTAADFHSYKVVRATGNAVDCPTLLDLTICTPQHLHVLGLWPCFFAEVAPSVQVPGRYLCTNM
jgi:hypothetical protein